MNALGLIPARAGSKGIPRKNVRNLAGKPLSVWTIEAALACPGLSSVVVSTDDEEIADIARANGAQVPFLRPAALATDDATSLMVVEHALTQLIRPIEAVVLLQPTSPLRTTADICAVLSRAAIKIAPSVVSITRAEQHPNWMYNLTGSGNLSSYTTGAKIARRQDLPPVYVPNGAIYFSRVEWLARTREFIGPDSIGYEMPAERSIDIDDPIDWRLAEHMLGGESGAVGT